MKFIKSTPLIQQLAEYIGEEPPTEEELAEERVMEIMEKAGFNRPAVTSQGEFDWQSMDNDTKAQVTDELVKKYQETKDNKFKAMAFGGVRNTMFKFVNEANQPFGAPEAALKAEAKKIVYDAMDRYDPSKSRFNTFLTSQFKPLGLDGPNALNKVNADFGSARAMQRSHLGDANALRKAKEDFKRLNGYEPTADQLAQETNLPVDQVRKMLREIAGTYDSDYSNQNQNLFSEAFGPERSIIWAVYRSMVGSKVKQRRQKLMEYMFPDILNPSDPPPDNIDLDTGLGKWAAKQFGVSEATISRDRAKIQEAIESAR